ncbi:hypothetical protein ACYSNV_04355 [Myroides sp. LJL119]
MLKNINWARVGIVVCTIVFLITAVTFEIFELGSLPAQFFGTLLGVVITAIITVLLLQGQTKSELERERNLRVFIKKQKVFFQFLTQLNILLQKENLPLHLSQDKSMDREVINLQDLLFEIGFLQMHTSDATYNQILDLVGNLLSESKKLKQVPQRTQSDLEAYYDNISVDFFHIVSLLKSELYAQAPTQVDKEKLNRIINLSF